MELTALGGRLYFWAYDPAAGYELWQTQVQTVAERVTLGLQIMSDALVALGDTGELNSGVVNSLVGKLDSAQASLESGNTTAVGNKIGVALNQLRGLVAAGKLTAAQADPLIAVLTGLQELLSR